MPKGKLPITHGYRSCFFVCLYDTSGTRNDRLADLAIRVKYKEIGILVPQEPDAIIQLLCRSIARIVSSQANRTL
jgi:hypothetical protein